MDKPRLFLSHSTETDPGGRAIIDQLEARGYIGAFDGSNARQVLRREGGAATQGAVGDDADEDCER